MSDFVILSEVSLDPLLDDTGLSLALMVLMVVFAALMLVRIFMDRWPGWMAAVAGNSLARTEEAPQVSSCFTFASASSPAAGSAPSKSAAPPSDEVPEHVAAIIAAVVADIVGKSHRILRTRELGPENLSWSMHGRLQNHISYRLK